MTEKNSKKHTFKATKRPRGSFEFLIKYSLFRISHSNNQVGSDGFISISTADSIGTALEHDWLFYIKIILSSNLKITRDQRIKKKKEQFFIKL